MNGRIVGRTVKYEKGNSLLCRRENVLSICEQKST